MTDVVERYLTLGLALGQHVDGLVDSYYGPPELADAVNAPPPVDSGRAGRRGGTARLRRVDRRRARRAATRLARRIRSTVCAPMPGALVGETLSYADEVEQCYGVRPQLGSEAAYGAAHEAARGPASRRRIAP